MTDVPGNPGDDPREFGAPDPETKGEEGWDWFSNVQTQVAEERMTSHGLTETELASLYARVFKGRAGKIVLQDIMLFAHARLAFDPAMGFYNGAAYGFYREGIRQTPLYIDKMVQRGGS